MTVYYLEARLRVIDPLTILEIPNDNHKLQIATLNVSIMRGRSTEIVQISSARQRYMLYIKNSLVGVNRLKNY